MAGIKELIRTEEDNTLSFGNYDLPTKGKVSDYVFDGDVYKVKTFHDITRLEKNETFAYESTPGTVVTDYKETEDTLSFIVNGFQDTQIIVAVEDDTRSYSSYIAQYGKSWGRDLWLLEARSLSSFFRRNDEGKTNRFFLQRMRI